MGKMVFEHKVRMISRDIKDKIESTYKNNCIVGVHVGPDIATIHLLYPKNLDIPNVAKSIALYLKRYFKKVEMFKEELQKNAQIDIVLWR